MLPTRSAHKQAYIQFGIFANHKMSIQYTDWFVQIRFMCSKCKSTIMYKHLARCTHGSNQFNLLQTHLCIQYNQTSWFKWYTYKTKLPNLIHFNPHVHLRIFVYRTTTLHSWFKVAMLPTQYTVSLYPVFYLYKTDMWIQDNQIARFKCNRIRMEIIRLDQ